ncbi:sugar kinase [uncultured Jannaschia sp.]|uniref:tagatose kinase n=1 Tax=uncultured Jannaschia sp. TaxID=293347 RepID=UPI0026118F79|nr:sugar kinase [uncultured Jannaschia sp.]
MTRGIAPDALGPTICAGEILVEIVATRPGAGFREVLDLTGPYPSGAPAIFIDQCARLGGRAAMIGAVGDDDFGAVNLDRLRRDGAELSGVAVDPERPTGSAFVRYRPDGARDFVYNIAHSAAARFGWSPAVEALTRRAGHLHVMGTALSMPAAREVIARAAEIVLARGGSLSVDPNLRKEIAHDAETEALFADLMGRAALCLPSGGELARAAGVAGSGAVAALHERGVGEVVLKRGAAGATLFRPGRDPRHAPAFAVAEVDPTGAGDCFGAVYLTCRRLGMAPERALDDACAAGARNVAVRGPMEGAATRAELDAFIAATPRRTP